VYWLDGVSVMKVPIAGGSPVVLAPGQSQANAIAVNGESVWWTTTADDGALLRTPLD
jgi:hypothetical protein